MRGFATVSLTLCVGFKDKHDCTTPFWFRAAGEHASKNGWLQPLQKEAVIVSKDRHLFELGTNDFPIYLAFVLGRQARGFERMIDMCNGN